MYELAKIAGWMLSPLVMALLIGAFALVLSWCNQRRLGVMAGSLVVVGLWISATPLVANSLVFSLERRFPAVPADQAPQADAIVLLGGALSAAHLPERPDFDLGSAADRVWHAAALFKAGKASLILVAGGHQPWAEQVQAESEAMRSMLLALGVPAAAIRAEVISRNTHENAKESLRMVQAVGVKRVLLVTSAMHMPRAIRIFSTEMHDSGVILLPASTDVVGLPDSLHPMGRWLPDAESLALSTRALKEYMGLAVWSLRGL